MAEGRRRTCFDAKMTGDMRAKASPTSSQRLEVLLKKNVQSKKYHGALKLTTWNPKIGWFVQSMFLPFGGITNGGTSRLRSTEVEMEDGPRG